MHRSFFLALVAVLLLAGCDSADVSRGTFNASFSGAVTQRLDVDDVSKGNAEWRQTANWVGIARGPYFGIELNSFEADRVADLEFMWSDGTTIPDLGTYEIFDYIDIVVEPGQQNVPPPGIVIGTDLRVQATNGSSVALQIVSGEMEVLSAGPAEFTGRFTFTAVDRASGTDEEIVAMGTFRTVAR